MSNGLYRYTKCGASTGLRRIADGMDKGEIFPAYCTVFAGAALYHCGQMTDAQTAKQTERLVSQRKENGIDEIERAIHYPECWDTMTYPTLLDAIKELGCNECDCTKTQQSAHKES